MGSILKLALILLVAFTELSESNPVPELLSLYSRSSSGLIRLDDRSLAKFLTTVKTPRPYWVLVFFDATKLHDKLELHLKELRKEFAVIASSFIKNNQLVESLDGVASFISNVFNGAFVPCNLDFAYSVSRDPIVIPYCKTTLIHGHFDFAVDGDKRCDRVLQRVRACDPIRPLDLPEYKFDFGMAVGVGGEIAVETVEKLVEIYSTMFVDIQALIRAFDGVDETVKLEGLKESGFFHLLSRIGFLKASAEEVLFLELEEVRKLCCVVVTNERRGCKVYWRDGEVEVGPFPTNQVDPTGV